MYGYEPANFEPTVDFYIRTSHPDHHSDIQKLFSISGETYSFTNRIYTLDGRLRHIQTIGYPIKEGATGKVKIAGTMQDITEQKNLHEELQEKTRAIHSQYELARQAELVQNVSTWQWNVPNGKIYWSENLFKIFEYTPYSFEPTLEKFMSMVHSDNTEVITQQ